MQGHTLKTNVVLMILRGVCNHLESVKTASLQENAPDKAKAQVVKEYRNHRKNVKDVLDMNTEYRQCFLYKKIQEDVQQYITREFEAIPQ
jgi:predicted SnoaL-like aldol condensation-catalyzing enzyme